MAIIAYYSSAVNENVSVAWQCSQCGTLNHSEHRISTSAQTRNKQKTHIKAEKRLKKTVDQYIRRTDKMCYSHANLKCKCTKCGHKEPWAKMRYLYIDFIVNVIIALYLCVLIYPMISEGIIPLIYFLAITVLWLPIRLIHSIVMNSKTKKLPRESIAVVDLVYGNVDKKREEFLRQKTEIG